MTKIDVDHLLKIDELLQVARTVNVKEQMQMPTEAGYVKPFYATREAETPTATTSTPLNTGISIGGLGSAYAQTPAGTTPFISWSPGVFVTPYHGNQLRMANYFYSERAVGSYEIYIYDVGYFLNSAIHNPLLRPDGSWWFDGTEDMDTVHARFQEMIQCPSFYEDNITELTARDIELSPQTVEAYETGNKSEAHYNMILDVYCDSVIRPVLYTTSLTGNIEDENIAGMDAYSADAMESTSLYPFTKTNYTKDDHSCAITRYDWSPIVRNNEEISGQPLCWTRFIIENRSDEVREITLARTQENISGAHLSKASNGGQDAHFYLQKTPKGLRNKTCSIENGIGLILGADDQQLGDFQGAISLAVQTDGNEDAWCSATEEYFDVFEGYVTSEALNTGRLRPKAMRMVHYTGREQMNGALCATVKLNPGERRVVTFTQAIDYPEINIGSYITRKQYDTFLDSKDYFERGETLLKKGAYEVDDILSQVIDSTATLTAMIEQKKWHAPTAEAKKHLTEMLLNQLSYFASSTVWDRDGRVLIKECAEYPFFNSLDVYFYGSFALFALMPQFDGAVMRDFAQAILKEMPETQRYHYYRFYPKGPVMDSADESPRSVRGAVIHDLGCIFDMEQDSYYWRNPKEWKDLAPKYVMMVLRHFRFTGDQSVVEDTFEAMQAAMEYLYNTFDAEVPLPIIRNGIGDTFDEIGAYGVTAYSATLWIAGLEAYCELMQILEKEDERLKYQTILQQARQALQRMLWDDEAGVYLFYTYPIEKRHLQECSATTAKKLKELSIDTESLVSGLNNFIYDEESDVIIQHRETIDAKFENNNLDVAQKKDRIQLKKMLLATLVPNLFTEEFDKVITKDANELFGDQLLADTMTAILGLPPVTSREQRHSIVQTLIEKSKNSLAGIRNVTSRVENEIFEQHQGQEVWIGVQFSLAAAMMHNGESAAAFAITENLYQTLYRNIRIPFAFPEAVMQWGYVTQEDLLGLYNGNEAKANRVLGVLNDSFELLEPNGRIKKNLTDSVKRDIFAVVNGLDELDEGDAEGLITLLEAIEINYTVGHYLRPGMIFSLLYLPE